MSYFLRWDAKRGMPLLESALPANSREVDFSILYAMDKAYTPAMGTFWRARIMSEIPDQAGMAARQLAAHGGVGDRELLRARLEKWRAAWKGREIPQDERALEMELVRGLQP